MTKQEIATSLRALVRRPRLALAAIVCLAIGIAATSAMLTLISATLWQSLPFPEAQRLVRVWLEEPGGRERLSLSYPDLELLQSSLTSLDELEASARSRMVFLGNAGGRRVEGEAVTGGYFELLGVAPLAGRFFLPEEQDQGAGVVVISHGLWGQRFGYDSQVLGRQIPTTEGPLTIIGIAPPEFSGSVEADSGDIEFWVPLNFEITGERRESRDIGLIWIVGKRAPGLGIGAVQSELDALFARLREWFPDDYADLRFAVEPLGENWRSEIREGNWMLLFAALGLVIIGALNVANLLATRTLQRNRELAVRAALGAGRWQLLRPILMETLILVLAGGLAGLAVGPFLLDFFLRFGGDAIPEYVTVSADLPTMLAVSAVLLLAGLLAGILPALSATRIELSRALHGGQRSTPDRGQQRAAAALVFAQIALTVALVVVSALLTRSTLALDRTDLGFRTENMGRIGLFVSERDVPPDAPMAGFYRRVTGAAAEHPEVDGVTLVWPTIPMWSAVQVPIRHEAMEAEAGREGLNVGTYAVASNLFDLMQIGLVSGRTFRTPAPDDEVFEAVVGRSLAERLGQLGNVLGMELETDDARYRVVGIAEDAHLAGPREDASNRFEFYIPIEAMGPRWFSMLVHARTDPAEVLPDLQERLAELAPTTAQDWVGAIPRTIDRLWLTQSRFYQYLTLLFSLSALFISGLGLYALMANRVARSTNEIGIRQALGANPLRIGWLYLRRALTISGAAIFIGLLLALAGGRMIAGQIYGVDAVDPLSYGVSAAVLVIVAVLATSGPAWRATRVAPSEALRDE